MGLPQSWTRPRFPDSEFTLLCTCNPHPTPSDAESPPKSTAMKESMGQYPGFLSESSKVGPNLSESISSPVKWEGRILQKKGFQMKI